MTTPTNQISAQVCKLLMGIVEQSYANITNSILLDELNDEEVKKFLLKENFLTKGKDSDSCWDGDDYKYVDWYDHLNSFAYLSLSGLVKVIEDDLKTYDINLSRIVDFFADEFEVASNSRTKNNEHIKDILYFVGDTRLSNQKMASIYFARRLSRPENFKRIDEFFLKQSTTRLKKLILTSSNIIYPDTTKAGSKIISVSKLLDLANNNKNLFNLDYVTNVVFSKGDDFLKPYVYCTGDGSLLFIGEENWKVKGSKQRQVIKIMCDHYAKAPDKKLKWDALLIEADLDESMSLRFRDLFKDSAVKEAIIYDDGFVWFKT